MAVQVRAVAGDTFFVCIIIQCIDHAAVNEST